MQIQDYFALHPGSAGLLLLVAFALFPRISMLFAMATPFGWLAWVGWLIAPHITVAIFATVMYWNTNPLLCVAAWILSAPGTVIEAVGAASASEKLR